MLSEIIQVSQGAPSISPPDVFLPSLILLFHAWETVPVEFCRTTVLWCLKCSLSKISFNIFIFRPPLWLLCTRRIQNHTVLKVILRFVYQYRQQCRPLSAATVNWSSRDTEFMVYVSLYTLFTVTVDVCLIFFPPQSSSHHNTQNCSFQGLILYPRHHSCIESTDSVSLFSPFLLAASPLRRLEPAGILCVLMKREAAVKSWNSQK